MGEFHAIGGPSGWTPHSPEYSYKDSTSTHPVVSTCTNAKRKSLNLHLRAYAVPHTKPQHPSPPLSLWKSRLCAPIKKGVPNKTKKKDPTKTHVRAIKTSTIHNESIRTPNPLHRQQRVYDIRQKKITETTYRFDGCNAAKTYFQHMKYCRKITTKTKEASPPPPLAPFCPNDSPGVDKIPFRQVVSPPHQDVVPREAAVAGVRRVLRLHQQRHRLQISQKSPATTTRSSRVTLQTCIDFQPLYLEHYPAPRRTRVVRTSRKFLSEPYVSHHITTIALPQAVNSRALRTCVSPMTSCRPWLTSSK